MHYMIEITDTFDGEANYSWITRHKIKASSVRGALIWLNRYSGLNFHSVGCDRFDSRTGVTCAFIEDWDDATHGTLSHVTKHLS